MAVAADASPKSGVSAPISRVMAVCATPTAAAIGPNTDMGGPSAGEAVADEKAAWSAGGAPPR